MPARRSPRRAARPASGAPREAAPRRTEPRDARAVAFAAFSEALDRGVFLDEAFARAEVDRLPPRDRGFARAIARTAFRHLGEIDAALDRRLAKPLPKEARPIRRVLQLAAAEIRHLDVAPYAAVDAAVRRAKRLQPRLAGLVNAVARRLTDDPPLAPEPALRANTPRWLWDRLSADWGPDAARAIASAQLREPPLDLTLKDPNAAAAWAERLGGATVPGGGVRLTAAGAVPELDGYADGAWWVQDAAAALPARMLPAGPGARVLDLCAAPGGKTLQLAATGARVTALDISDRRMARVRANLTRTQLAAEIVVADAHQWRPDALFDAVLVDAPCSASGTVRRHPELPWLKGAWIDGDEPVGDGPVGGGLAGLVAAQDALARVAWGLVRPGGAMVFCTCSLFQLEGEARADAFAAETPDARLDPVSPEEAARIGAEGLIDAAGRLRATPDRRAETGGLDGFFAARFLKQDPGAG